MIPQTPKPPGKFWLFPFALLQFPATRLHLPGQNGLGNVSPLCFLPSVDSNDSLYGGDSKFLAENNKLCETVMAQILEHLKILAKDEVGATRGKAPWTVFLGALSVFRQAYHCVPAASITCCAGLEPRSNRPCRRGRVCGRLYLLGLCM